MTQRTYKPGVYRVHGEEERGCETPIVYFDGQEWWRPGDDGPPHLSNKSGNLFIDENCIGLGDTDNRDTPTEVSSGWDAVTGGRHHSLGLIKT